ncbi:MAG: penicillin-binding protein 1C [Alphaproteobacteria bacterium]
MARYSMLDRPRHIALRAGAGLLALTLAAFAADRALPPDLTPLGETSTLVVSREGSVLRAFTNRSGIWRLPARVGQVDPLYLKMLVAYEDRRFAYHPGVDPAAVLRALAQWLDNGRVISGASTLSMQTARLLAPRRRSLAGKLAEMLRALQLEGRHSKDEILSMYLTLAPFGGNLEGARAASLAYFGKEPRRLTPGQAALLVALPQAPSTTRPDRYPKAAKAARDKVLRAMARAGVLSAGTAREAIASPVPNRRRALPFDAPHLARRLFAESAKKRGRIIRTSIDRRFQQALQEMVRHAAGGLGRKATIAVLVAENRTRKIRAYVASSDFFDRAREGQVDMIRAIRSPGSTLKPFVYAMGFDDGIIHPETIIADVPTRFGDYQPENFRRVYHGEVSVRVALQQSYNVPAVKVLDRVGPGRLAARLRQAGARLNFDAGRGRPGLPLALGGVGISLGDLTMLFTGLANGGIVGPLSDLRDIPGEVPAGRPMVSPAAAYMIARILEDAPPPADFVAGRNARRARKIAYKTGTSYGFRDAWSVGFDGTHTIGVWVGRPDGTPSPERYGRNTAAPILFRAFGLTASGPGPAPGKTPPGVRLAQNSDLPQHLRRFEKVAARGLAAPRALSIAFPPAGAVLELKREGRGYLALPLAAAGGRKPLKWLVNGRPVASSPYRRRASWIPDGEGFVRITVIDVDGRVARIVSRLK